MYNTDMHKYTYYLCCKSNREVELSLKAGIHFAKRNGLVFMMIKWSGFQS